MFGRRKVATLVAEFLGTGVLTLLILSLTRSQPAALNYVLIAGLTLAVMTFVFRSFSGAIFNPALTLALWAVRKISTVNALLFIVTQFLGAYAAYQLFLYMAPAELTKQFTSIAGEYSTQILVVQAVSTAIFAFGFAASTNKLLNRGTAAAVAGSAYAIALMPSLLGSFGMLNPAIALSNKAFELGTYVLGPIVGAIIGVAIYKYLFDEENIVTETAAATAKVNPATSTVVAPTTKPAATVAPSVAKKRTTTKSTATKKSATKTTAAKKPAAKRKTAPKKK